MNDLKDPAYSRAIYPRFGYAMKPFRRACLKFVGCMPCTGGALGEASSWWAVITSQETYCCLQVFLLEAVKQCGHVFHDLTSLVRISGSRLVPASVRPALECRSTRSVGCPELSPSAPRAKRCCCFTTLICVARGKGRGMQGAPSVGASGLDKLTARCLILEGCKFGAVTHSAKAALGP